MKYNMHHLLTGVASVHQVVLLDLHGLHLLLDGLHLQSFSFLLILLLKRTKTNKGQNENRRTNTFTDDKRKKCKACDVWHLQHFSFNIIRAARMDSLFSVKCYQQFRYWKLLLSSARCLFSDSFLLVPKGLGFEKTYRCAKDKIQQKYSRTKIS